MRSIVSWFTDNHVAANLLMIFLLVAGTITCMTMKLEVFPEISMDRITVTTKYIGASPAEVEEAVVKRIEENVAGLAGIKRIDSTAREGSGRVTIEVMKGWDLQALLDEVKAEVDRITTFPNEAEKPVVQEVTRRTRVINLAVYGDAPETSIKELATQIKDDITNLPGITLAEFFGVREAEIHIEISEKTLRCYGLTLGKVANIVKKSSLDLPAGNIKTGAGEILIRTKGRRYYASDYRDIAIITRPDGSKVTLGQIAELNDGFEDVDLFARFQGKQAAIIKVYRVADQNALKVADTVKQYINTIRDSLPAGIAIDNYRDRSVMLKSRINLLLKNMTIGLILVSILLGLFLNLRLAFWVTLGIPISFATGLWLLPQCNVSINMISLFGFIMVLGIVVDDAIVMGESIFRKQEEGLNPIDASIEGAMEVVKPVIFAVLTTIVAFWPLLLGDGGLGKTIRDLPVVVILVLAGSLIEALLILPSHLAGKKSRVPDNKTVSIKKEIKNSGFKRFVNGPYTDLLNFCIKWRYATIAFGIATLMVTIGIWEGGWIKFTLFPKVESDTLSCTLTMPAGTPAQRTTEVLEYLEQTAEEVIAEMDKHRPNDAPSLLEHRVSLIGRHSGAHGPSSGGPAYGSHLGEVYIQLLDGEERDISARKISKEWRRKVGTINDAESILFKYEIFSIGNPIEVHLSLDNHEQLLDAADYLKAQFSNYPGILDINDSFLPGKKEIQLKLRPAARSLGLTLNDLARQVRHAFYGAEALRLQRDQDEIKVLIRYPESERKSLTNMEEMRIRTPNGSHVPFSQVAQVKTEQGYSTIERAQRRRVIKVTADVDETIANANEVRAELESNILPQLKNLYPGLRYTIEGAGKEQKESMQDVFQGFSIAILAIYALLAIPFKSFTQPFIVLAAVPFGIVGAILGHLIMGMNLSILSLFGIVGCAGVVVNDSLVLVHAINNFRSQGYSARDAVTRAGPLRFRPIILTSLTTFAGLTPMLLERSIQAQFLIPMAISLAFGVLFATWITLLLIPCGYIVMDDLHNLAAGLKEKVLGH